MGMTITLICLAFVAGTIFGWKLCIWNYTE